VEKARQIRLLNHLIRVDISPKRPGELHYNISYSDQNSPAYRAHGPSTIKKKTERTQQ
jgi:hypothetical protein